MGYYPIITHYNSISYFFQFVNKKAALFPNFAGKFIFFIEKIQKNLKKFKKALAK
jgi:hypothetical protein